MAYAHDALGRITSMVETVEGAMVGKSYTYDPRGRLSSASSVAAGGGGGSLG